jgi:hypothetical protein
MGKRNRKERERETWRRERYTFSSEKTFKHKQGR